MAASLRQTFDCLVHTSLVGDLLNCLRTDPAAALLVSPTVHLRTVMGPMNPNDDDPTNQTEVVFSGYTAAAVTWETALVNLTQDGKGIRAVVSFGPSGTISPAVTAQGWYLTDAVDGDPTKVYAEGSFSDPVVFAAVGDNLDFVLVLPLVDQWA